MRHLLLVAFFFVSALGSVGQKSHNSKTSELSAGTLSGNIYANDTLGLSYEFPSDWTAAAADLKNPALVDSQKPNGLANQCSKVLLEISAPAKAEGRFTSFATLFAIDPRCLSAPPFPPSTLEKDQLNRVVDKIIKYFGHTLYFSPYGVKILALGPPGHVQILFTGGLIINAIEGHPAPAKEPLTVNTSFSLVESNGYWLAWAYVADDPSTEELQKNKISFPGAPSP
jgi:hypothetical protein